MRFVSGAPTSRIEAALTEEQFDAVMQYASPKKHSMLEKFFRLMGRCYIGVVCVVPFVLLAAVVIFPRWLAASCGAIGILLVIIAILYKHNDNPAIK
ncbi:MAG: hypothetical protein Phyf2KO_16990 [Phycisphaerales bacterium]